MPVKGGSGAASSFSCDYQRNFRAFAVRLGEKRDNSIVRFRGPAAMQIAFCVDLEPAVVKLSLVRRSITPSGFRIGSIVFAGMLAALRSTRRGRPAGGVNSCGDGLRSGQRGRTLAVTARQSSASSGVSSRVAGVGRRIIEDLQAGTR